MAVTKKIEKSYAWEIAHGLGIAHVHPCRSIIEQGRRVNGGVGRAPTTEKQEDER